MAESSCEGVNTASAASSRFPSVCSSNTSEHESETIHSTFARKSHGDTSVVPIAAENSIGASISTSEQQSSDIFSLSDQQLSDKLKFVKEVGFGNWGSVWLCEPRLAEEQAMFGPQIAVKLVHRSKTPTTAARVRSLWNEMKIVRALRREATTSGSAQDVVGVGHPNVIQFYSFVITPSYALITMQYLPIPVPVEVPEFRAKPWFHALTDAVAYLHQRGVVHNDIKPANIILTGGSSPMPVLVDFGFAEHYTLTSRHAFQSNLAYGTPEYLAPERAKGQPHDTRKSDVYALGITFFEILVGRTPFEEVEGESFVSKEDLERYWTRTVKGKWIGKWEGIMSKPCEKALKRMTLPNADLRATASDVLADPYFKGEDEMNRSNLSVDLSVLSDIIPPWSRHTLAQSRSKAQASIKNKQASVAQRPSALKAATTRSALADKENVQPIRSETVKSRTGTLHRTSKSITEAFRKSVGTSKKAPRKTAVEVFEIVTPGNVAIEHAPVIKPKESNSVLKRKNSAAVLKDKNSPKVLKEQSSTNVLREKSLKPKDSVNILKEKKSAVALKEKRSAFTLAPKKKEPAQDKENVKLKGHGKTFSMTLSFSRSFGRKQAKEKEKEDEGAEQSLDKRPSMYFSREPESPNTPTDSSSPVEPPKVAISTNTTTRERAQASLNPRDVRSVFNIAVEPSIPTNTSDSSNATATNTSSRLTNSSTTSRSIVFSIEPEAPSTPQATSTPANSGSVRTRQALFDRTHKLETPERTPVTPRSSAVSKPLAKNGPRLSTVAQSPASSTTSPSPVANKARVSKIAAKENRRTNIAARTSPAKPRGTPVKAKPSPTRVRASPAKVTASPARPRNSKAPVFTIGPKANTGSKVPAKKVPAKVLGDATNTAGSVKVKPSQNANKVGAKTEESHEDEGDDTITLPVEVIRSSAIPRMSKSSSASIIKQSILQSIDKAVRFGRSSVSATEIIQSGTLEITGRRRSLSVDEAFNHQHDQSVSENQESQMANWIRGVEKVVEDTRQSFQVGDSAPLALPPPPPRLNHSQSAGLTRISTSAKDPTIRTIVSNVNPSVTTFAAGPQAPGRNRRATVGSTTPTPPSTASSSTFDTTTSPQGRLSRPITPCLNAELGKEPVAVTSPRLCDVIDADSRKLILGQVGMSESACHSRSTSYESNSGRTTISSDAQRAHFFQNPSPSHSRTHSRMTSTNSALSRPTTAMSGKMSVQDANVETTEQVYEKFLKTQTVVRKGKGYQSDYTIRGKGIEHIASGSDTESDADTKQGFFTRVASPTNLVPERAYRAFKTMMSGGPKKRAPTPSANSVFVGGGFGPGNESSRTKPLTSYPRSWSRAQAA
ncbi:unnamed protein product [Rhizoctonia solani]|uniref:Protein kinase domain-containing protein n=1 Tax=Rhizoctonia solani TaxID=456999 RepID=A0A8H3E5U2_9AGAM|nr:unnamed protein product [Rhizoctonia solani]